MKDVNAWVRDLVQKSIDETLAAIEREKAAKGFVGLTEALQKGAPVVQKLAETALPKKIMVFSGSAAVDGHAAMAHTIVLAPMNAEPRDFVTKDLPKVGVDLANAVTMTKEQTCVARYGAMHLDGVWDASRANNRAAVWALVEACSLKISHIASVEFYTDSTWLANAIGTWVGKWEKNDWVTSTGVAPRDVDTWKVYVSSTTEEFRSGLKVHVVDKSPAQAACKNKAFAAASKAAEQAKGRAALENVEKTMTEDAKLMDELEKGLAAATKVVVADNVIA